MNRKEFISKYQRLFHAWTTCREPNLPGLCYSKTGGELADRLAAMHDKNPQWVDDAEDLLLADYQLNRVLL
jgi:hypothetical protein